MGCQNCILRAQWHFKRNFFSKNHINWHCERKNSAGFDRFALFFPGNFWANNSRSCPFGFFSSHCQILQAWVAKTVFHVSRALFAELFSQNHNNWHCEGKKSAGFDRFAFFFSGELLSKKFSFSSPCQILQAWGAKTVFYVSSGTFCGIFFRRIILIGTVSEKIQLLLSKLHSTFPGKFCANNSRSCPFGFFSSPCQIL